ncbi:protein MENT [Natator depressus]|uniref:protein MENT n=1 Tax=Natator depressus TaxID=27790 RepID=UPI003EBD6F39
MRMGLLPGALALLLALQAALALAVGPGGRNQPQEATARSSSTMISGMTAPTAMATLSDALARATTPEVGGQTLEASSKKVVTPGNGVGYEFTTANGEEYEVIAGSNGGYEVTTGNDILSNTTGSGGVIGVRDTHYKWLAWSKWYCNCEMGSMSRVRDIAYTVPGLQLDPDDYNALRFQRIACSYSHCKCSRKHRECDHAKVTCDAPNLYLCAVRDVRRARYRQARHFWIRVRMELKGLWKSIRKAFSQLKEVRMGWRCHMPIGRVWNGGSWTRYPGCMVWEYREAQAGYPGFMCWEFGSTQPQSPGMHGLGFWVSGCISYKAFYGR